MIDDVVLFQATQRYKARTAAALRAKQAEEAATLERENAVREPLRKMLDSCSRQEVCNLLAESGELVRLYVFLYPEGRGISHYLTVSGEGLTTQGQGSHESKKVEDVERVVEELVKYKCDAKEFEHKFWAEIERIISRAPK